MCQKHKFRYSMTYNYYTSQIRDNTCIQIIIIDIVEIIIFLFGEGLCENESEVVPSSGSW